MLAETLEKHHMSASHANALGVAIWAKLSAEAEAKVERGEHLELTSWRSGDRVRLLELISAFATAESKAFGSDAARSDAGAVQIDGVRPSSDGPADWPEGKDHRGFAFAARARSG